MKSKGWKQFAGSLILAAFLAFLPAAGRSEALPLEGAAPYPPVESALSEDGLSYDDGTMRVRIEKGVENETRIYWAEVSVTDPSQIRTALAGGRGSQKNAQPVSIARRANAVLALNGDFFTSHNTGVVYRQGQILRDNPAGSRDELIIDENGDLTILTFSFNATKAEIRKAFDTFQEKHQIRESFCFGPGLIIDGETQHFDYRDKVSCGYPTRAQRIIFCQTGPLEYLFLVTEGKEQNQPGFTVPECVELLEKRGGILQAYNLDGGNSSQIILCGNKINAAEYGKSRDISDMICFATLVNSQQPD